MVAFGFLANQLDGSLVCLFVLQAKLVNLRYFGIVQSGSSGSRGDRATGKSLQCIDLCYRATVFLKHTSKGDSGMYVMCV